MANVPASPWAYTGIVLIALLIAVCTVINRPDLAPDIVITSDVALIALNVYLAATLHHTWYRASSALLAAAWGFILNTDTRRRRKPEKLSRWQQVRREVLARPPADCTEERTGE